MNKENEKHHDAAEQSYWDDYFSDPETEAIDEFWREVVEKGGEEKNNE
jgi:hypothetical protein